MTKKATKRALLFSVLSLVLCMSMFVGTTYAWFTDSVTSGNNIIKTGNLDMKLSYKPYGAENTEWTEVDANTVLFGKDALYEPGYTEAVWLKIENLGSLAFRYDLAINVANEKQGTNKAGEKFSLSDHLEVKYMTTTSTDMESNYYTTRDSLDSFAFGAAANSGIASLSDDIAVIENGVAFSKDDATNGAYNSAYVLVVISMPTTVGNEANHNGEDIPQIDFTLTALATQLAYEEDSFGKDYDKDAEYLVADTWDGTADDSWYEETKDIFVIENAEQLAGFRKLVNEDKITFANKTVELVKDIDLAGLDWEAIGHYGSSVFSGTFDGNGHTISNMYTSTYFGANSNIGTGLFGAVTDGCTIKDLTIKNARVWSSGYYGAAVVASVSGGNVTFENVTVEDSVICAGKHVGGIVGITGRTGFAQAEVTFNGCSIKNVELVWVNANDRTSNAVGTVGQANPVINGLDTITEENVTVVKDRNLFYSYQVGVQP